MRWSCVLACCLVCSTFAAAQDAKKPALALDAGGHTAVVESIQFTPDNQRLITVSHDKTVRIWDLSTGELVRTLRPPSGVGSDGELWAGALSPDGKTLAVGGFGPKGSVGAISLISLAGGDTVRVLKGHRGCLVSLAFSRDGQRLASASADKTARIWNVATGTCEQTLAGHTDTLYGVAFSPDGKHLITASADKTARIWTLATAKTEAVLKGHQDVVYSVAWSADGKTLATGSADQSLRLWEPDGSLRKQVDKLGAAVNALAFSADSGLLLYSGARDDQHGGVLLDLAGGQEVVRFAKHTNTVVGVALSPDGSLAATSGGNDPEVYVWKTKDGSVVQRLAGKGHGIWSAAWSKDGKAIAWGTTNRGNSLRASIPLEHSFDLDQQDFGLDPDNESYCRAQFDDGPVCLEIDGPTSLVVKRGKDTCAKCEGDSSTIRCFTLVPGDRLAIGTTYGLYLYDAKTGKSVREFRGHTGEVFAVAPSPDGRYLLSASHDQTLRIWGLDRDEPLLSLFFAGNEWIAWTPEGYYTASSGGEQLIGWQVNNGPDKLAAYYPASQFRKTLYRPDVIRKLVTAGNLATALAAADKERDQATRSTEVSQVLPPKVAITSPKGTGLRQTKAALEVEAVATGAANNPVASLCLLLDGRPYGGEAGLKAFRTPKPGDVRATWTVDLPPGNHRLAVQVAGTASAGLSGEVEVAFAPAGQEPDKAGAQAGTLYVLAIGINDYPKKLKLDAAAPDARSIDQAFHKNSAALFHKVETKLLDSKETTTRKSILDGLDWLQAKAKPGDVAVVFYAGHGDCKIAGQFYILPVDVNLDDLPGTAISGDVLKTRLGTLPCSTLLLLDACYSGSIDVKKKRSLPAPADNLVRDFVYDEGLVVMCGAAKEHEAIEENGHGYFTNALVAGLAGDAKDRDGLVTLSRLGTFVEERVKEQSKGDQEATISRPSTIRSFPLAKP